MASLLINLASVALVLPGCALALYFHAVKYLTEHTVGEWLDALAVALDRLPPADHLALWSIGGGVALLAMLYAMIRVPWLLPSLVLCSGIASAAYIGWLSGPAVTNPILWLSLIGIGLSLLQLSRCRSGASVRRHLAGGHQARS